MSDAVADAVSLTLAAGQRLQKTVAFHRNALRFRLFGEINRIDELTEPAETAAVRSQDQARQIPDLRLVLFLALRGALDDFTTSHDIGEILI